MTHGFARSVTKICQDLLSSIVAREGGPARPNLWWRYRDDIVEVWTHGLPRLNLYYKRSQASR